MKKVLWLLSILTLCLGLSPAAAGNRPLYVVSIAPLASIVGELVGARADVARLLPIGASHHTYAPRPSDAEKAERSAALIYVSPKLDGFAAALSAPVKIALFDFLPKDLQVAAAATADADGETHAVGGMDAHFWTDPLAVKAVLPPLVARLCALDAEGCPVYRKNAVGLEARLQALHDEVAARLAPVKGRAIVLAYPCSSYFFHRYGIPVAGIAIATPGREPSPRELQDTIRMMAERKLNAIFTLPEDSDRPAQVIAEATGARIVMLDFMGGSPGRTTYFDMIRYNAERLFEALQ